MSKVRRNFTSFLVKIRTAISEARCNAVKKKRSGSEIRFETSARWPELEIGRNSVAAWIIARSISVIMSSRR